MKILSGNEDVIAAYCHRFIPEAADSLKPGTFRSLGVLDKDYKLICGIVFFNARPWDIEIGIAADSPKWCTKNVLGVVFDYCFNQLKVERVSGLQAASNVRAHKLVEGLGFKREGVVRQGWFGKEDAWVYGMLKAECRWI